MFVSIRSRVRGHYAQDVGPLLRLILLVYLSSYVLKQENSKRYPNFPFTQLASASKCLLVEW